MGDQTGPWNATNGDGKLLSKSQHKILPSSKTREWQGLDRIGLAVHEMECIWREQTKDDIGIDGEIELTQPREDGNGRIGTAKYIKVQAKSGSSYIKLDSDDSFESPISKSDLHYWKNSNVPVVFIVYHPEDDQLYWIDLKEYVKNNPSVYQEPHRLKFDKQSDKFTGDSYTQISKLCIQAQPRVSHDVTDLLYISLLEVLSLPQEIYVSQVQPGKRAMFRHRISEEAPPYLYRDGVLITLTDPSTQENLIKPDEVEVYTTEDWLKYHDSDADRKLTALMNQALRKFLLSKGLSLEDKGRKFFFPTLEANDKTALRKSWQSSKSGKSYTRTVTSYHEYGKYKFYKHLALIAKFQQYDEKWGLFIDPSHYYSLDGGFDKWTGEAARSHAIRFRSREYNQHMLNHILFWAHFLSDGQDEWLMSADENVLLKISGQIPKLKANFGIPFTKELQ